MQSKRQIYLPLVLALVFVLGILLGIRLSSKYQKNSQVILKLTDMGFNKMNEMINYIEQEYVDTVQRSQLIDKTINSLLQELDPHSYYIAPEEFAEMNDPLEGNFDGIGIEFTIQNDTLMVISPIAGGPSELAGIKAGDRIVEVSKENIAGVGVTNKKIFSLLKGTKGSVVDLKILRKGSKKSLFFHVTRDKIPLHSLDASYMVNDSVGYIKLSRFSRTTYQEFIDEALNLKALGMKKMILDLRGNGGGFLDEAIKIADEFLSKGNNILFTEGKARPKKYYRATSVGSLEDIRLSVLVDEGTASASEIISGAIQDNDRGLIIGRRTYGKGLVQEQSNWPDGSALRLTIARYYTPSGRSIQRSYAQGSKNYHLLHDQEFETKGNGDTLFSMDTLRHYTKSGRVVYGGGGIYPDVLASIDTSDRTVYLVELYFSGVVREFAIDFVDKKRHEIHNKYPNHSSFSKGFFTDDKLFFSLLDFAASKGVAKNMKEANISRKRIENFTKASIGRYLYGNEGFYSTYNQLDEVVQKALQQP